MLYIHYTKCNISNVFPCMSVHSLVHLYAPVHTPYIYMPPINLFAPSTYPYICTSPHKSIHPFSMPHMSVLTPYVHIPPYIHMPQYIYIPPYIYMSPMSLFPYICTPAIYPYAPKYLYPSKALHPHMSVHPLSFCISCITRPGI